MASRLVLVAFLLPGLGCAHAPRRAWKVPRRCIQINVESFTRPCNERADGKFVCDGVVISANCIEK